jgi:predicted amidophosphoribosyltransferase
MLGGLVGGIILIVHLIRNSGASHSPAGASLSPCPDCGRPLSPLATTCPQCGRPLAKDAPAR